MRSVFERSLALILIAVLSPLLFFIGLVIWYEDGGPVIFRQTRVGYKRKLFTVYKFRTMRDQPWSTEDVIKNDKRVTRPGFFLRRTHLDELPQLWNIIRGEMVFVGPRPQSVALTQLYSELYSTRYNNRFQLLPGITGLNQVFLDKRNHKDLPRYIALDELYRKKRSIGLDAVLALKTFIKMFQGNSC